MTFAKSVRFSSRIRMVDHTAGLATLLVSQWEFQSPATDIYGGRVEALVKGAIGYLIPVP
jgi:hypothetical protein